MKQEGDRGQLFEEQLNTQNQFLKYALDALPYPLYIVNAESYVVEMANAAAHSGHLRGDITCFKLLHGSDRPCADDGYPCPLQEIKQTKKPVIKEHMHLNKEGEFQYVEVHGYPILDEAGNVTHMIEYTLDITERKPFEDALRESETNWRSLIETLPDHILMLDTDLNIRFANFASPGLTVDELIGTPLYTYVEAERQDEVKAILEGVLKTGKEAQYETVYHSPDGNDIYYETYVTARRLAGVNEIFGLTLGSRDITERVRIDMDRQALTRALGERVKELSCLYSISKLIMTPDISLDKILQGTVNLIPPSWQYPQITCARVILEEQDFRTENYQESHWKQTADIFVHGEISGFLEVCYQEEMPEIDEGPFLMEERNLIDAIAERLGRTTERVRAEQQLQRLATHDPLTELPNRFLFLDRLNQILSIAKRESSFVGVMFMDLDGFKTINDTFGHEKGDQVLKIIGQRLGNCVRQSDTIARMGGDEFTICLGRITDPLDAANVASKIIQCLSRPIQIDGDEVTISTSIGISIFPQDGQDADELLLKADQALYTAKTKGKNVFIFHTQSRE